MPELDPKRELPAGHELLDLPPPHHRAGWNWLFSLVISTVVMFTTTLTLIVSGMTYLMVSIVAITMFVLSLFLVHAIAERAR